MSHNRLPLIEIVGLKPASQLVDAHVLTEHYQQTLTLKQANHDAEQILRSARRKTQLMVRQAARQQRQMRAELQKEKARLNVQIMNDCEHRWLQKQVILIRQGEAVQQQLIAEVSGSIQRNIEKVLTAWFDQQSCETTLCERLSKQVEKMAGEEILTLRLHPDRLEAAQNLFGQRLRILPEPQFNVDQAILASAQLSVEIDLHRHFQQLLAWLNSPVEFAQKETTEND